MDGQAYTLIMRRLAALERRLKAVLRTGQVHAIRHDPYRVQVDIGPGTDGEPVLTDFLPVFVPRAGRVRVWTPLTQGERVRVESPGGEDTVAFVTPGLFSMDFEAPDDDPATQLVRIDADDGTEVARIEVTRAGGPATSAMLIRCGRSALRLGGDGASTFSLDILDYEDPP